MTPCVRILSNMKKGMGSVYEGSLSEHLITQKSLIHKTSDPFLSFIIAPN